MTYFAILQPSQSTGARRAKKSVVRMLVIVVVLFSVCWLPFHVVVLYDNFGGKYTNVVLELVMFSLWLSFANSCCNPVVYAVLNRNYRREFGRLLRYVRLSLINTFICWFAICQSWPIESQVSFTDG